MSISKIQMSLYNHNHIEWLEKKKQLKIATGNLIKNRYIFLNQVNYPIEIAFVSTHLQLVEQVSRDKELQYIEGTMILAGQGRVFRMLRLTDLWSRETILGRKINHVKMALKVQYHDISIYPSKSLGDRLFQGEYSFGEKKVYLGLNENIFKKIKTNIKNNQSFQLQIHLNDLENSEGIYSMHLPNLAMNIVLDDNPNIPIYGAGNGALKKFNANKSTIEISKLYIVNTSKCDTEYLIAAKGMAYE
jgi:hypothetical protein